MGEARSYSDFTLELRDLDRERDTFKVALLPSQAVGETTAVQVPLRYEDMEDALSDIDDWVDQETLITLGEQLTDRLLPGRIRPLFENALRQVGQNEGIRLRLVIQEPQLAQLPWELCYLDMRGGEKDQRHFLALNPQISFVRHVPLEKAHPDLSGGDRDQLRIVAATANVEGKAFKRLNLKKERHVIEGALQDFNVDGTTLEWTAFLEDTTSEALAEVLLSKKADLFHFAGHGVFENVDIDLSTGAPRGQGAIVLAEGNGSHEPEYLEAAKLATQLQQAGIRLAVLGACDSGRHDGVSPWTGVAPALVERGIPAVVAMQFEVQDRLAIAFSKAFYAALAAGLSVDEAVAVGRQAMLGKSSENDVDWAVPVLYMRSSDGMLFPARTDQPSKTRDQIRQVVEQTIEVIEKGGEVTGIEADFEHGSFNLHMSVRQQADTVKGNMTGAKLSFGGHTDASSNSNDTR